MDNKGKVCCRLVSVDFCKERKKTLRIYWNPDEIVIVFRGLILVAVIDFFVEYRIKILTNLASRD